MQKAIPYILSLVCFFTAREVSHAQTSTNEKVVTVDAGLSLVGGIIDVLIGSGEAIDTDTTNNYIEINNSEVSGGRALVVGFDYGISDRWSMGFFMSTQRRHGSTDFTFENDDNQIVTEKVNFNLRRNTIGFSPKIHYGASNRTDLYSGARAGVLFWNNTIESPSGNFDLFNDIVAVRPIFSLTVFGVRFYPTDYVGLNFELNLGAPNIIGMGATVRFP